MDAETLGLPDAGFDAVLCALGLMYVPDPEQALREMRRVLRPGGRVAIAMWSEPAHCGWSAAFSIIDAEAASAVCPMFFRRCQGRALARALAEAQFETIRHCRIFVTLVYADAQRECDAVFAGGPAALAWSRFDAAARQRVCARYLAAIEAWRDGAAYRVPAEFVVATGVTPRDPTRVPA